MPLPHPCRQQCNMTLLGKHKLLEYCDRLQWLATLSGTSTHVQGKRAHNSHLRHLKYTGSIQRSTKITNIGCLSADQICWARHRHPAQNCPGLQLCAAMLQPMEDIGAHAWGQNQGLSLCTTFTHLPVQHVLQLGPQPRPPVKQGRSSGNVPPGCCTAVQGPWWKTASASALWPGRVWLRSTTA